MTEADAVAEASPGRVLVVDPDYDTLASIARVLRQRGLHVVLAADGRAGLQRAVEVAADVVLLDRDVPVVDVRTFLEVLRDNPRTSSAHVFLMGTGEPAQLSVIDPRADPIVKPFNADEVGARVAEALRKRRGAPREPELRGDLAQVAIVDLLQVFAANRRTGRLAVHGLTATGEVWVRGGLIVDALWAGAVGEKALFRLLSIQDGQFVFVPGLEPERTRIESSTDHLLMEGARQTDEIARIRDRLPPLGALISVAPGAGAGVTRGLEAQLVAQLEEPRAIEELMDLLPTSDAEVLRAIATLLEAGTLLVFEPRGQTANLCTADEAIALRAAATRLRRPGLDGPVRIGVLTASHEEAARFGRALGRVVEFVAAAQAPVPAGGGALGALGAVRLDGTDVELFALPLDPPLRPLWGPLLAPSSVVLTLTEGPPDEELLDVLSALSIRAVHAPAGWERPVGAAAAIRAALAQATPRSPHPRG